MLRLPGFIVAITCLTAACDRTPHSEDPNRRDSSNTATDVRSASDADTSTLHRVTDWTAVWYQKSRELDVTGDGRPDTLLLQAFGRVVDSMAITFSVITSGDTVLVDDWESDYQLIDPPTEAIAIGPGRDAYVRRALDSTLARVQIAAFNDSTLSRPWIPRTPDYLCGDDANNCIVGEVRTELAPKGWTADRIRIAPFDTARARAIVDDIRRTAVKSMTLAYGYETVNTYVWSQLAKKFYTVAACC